MTTGAAMTPMEELLTKVAELTGMMDDFARALPGVRGALAALDETILEIGPAAARRAGIGDHEEMEAALIDALSGRFETSRVRLLAALL